MTLIRSRMVCAWRLAFAVALLANAVVGLMAAEAQEPFDQANKFYEEGKFQEAASAYTNLLQSGKGRATIYYNLGNAWFKAGMNGRAIAAYREAEKLTPRDPNLRFNLEFVRKKVTGFESGRRPAWQRFLTDLTLNEWTVLAACSYWIWFVMLALREFRPSLKRTLRGYTASVGLVAALLAGCVGAAAYEQSVHMEAVVVVTNAVVRQGPLETSRVVYQVPDGTEVTVLDQKEGDNKQLWLQVQDASKRLGWLQRDQVTVINSKFKQ